MEGRRRTRPIRERWRRALPAALLCAAAAPAAQAQPIEILDGVCARHIAAEEARRDIPAGLLSAVALAESGRRPDASGATIAWPWTVMAEDRGRFFPTRAAAVAAVRALRARGVANIDVGCMQVNLMFHGDAFASVEAALDPARNVRYAADLLERLEDRHGSWVQAVGHYHSATTEYNRPYMLRVFTYWVEVRKVLAAAPPRPAPPPALPAPPTAEPAAPAGPGAVQSAARPEAGSEPEAKPEAVPGAAPSEPEPDAAAGPGIAERRARFADWIARRLGRPPS